MVSPSEETQRDEDWQGHDVHDHRQAWTIQDWQHKGYQRILSRYESFSTHNPSDHQREGVHNLDFSIQVEELGSSQHGLRPQDCNLMDMFTYAPPMTDTTHPPCSFRRSCHPLQDTEAAHFLLNLEILRPRLLSGTVQSVQFLVLLAAVDILVDNRELSTWSSGCKR